MMELKVSIDEGVEARACPASRQSGEGNTVLVLQKK
jgi:hypothetical protein